MADLLFESSQFIETHRLLPRGARILVAFSGGPDSMALLDLLLRLAPQYGWAIAAASVDHGLRPESAAEHGQLKALVRSLGIPFFGRAVELDFSGSFETAAREARYDALNAMAREFEADFLALGHHADDQLETLVMRLARGAASAGMCGIPLVRPQSGGPTIIRPLLLLSRKRIEEYCLFRGLQPLSDPTNLDKAFSRNRVRWDVLPVLRDLNPRAAEVAARNALIRNEENQFLEGLAFEEFGKIAELHEECSLSFEPEKLLALPLPIARRVVVLALSKLLGGHRLFSEAHVERVLVLAREKGKLDLVAGVRASVRYGRLWLTRDREFFCEPLREGTMVFPSFSIEAAVVADPSENGPFVDPFSAAFDLELLPPDLTWRPALPTDSFHPWGHVHPHPLNRFLTRSRVDPSFLSRLLVLAAGDEVYWVVGLRRSVIAPLSPATKKILVLAASVV